MLMWIGAGVSTTNNALKRADKRRCELQLDFLERDTNGTNELKTRNQYMCTKETKVG